MILGFIEKDSQGQRVYATNDVLPTTIIKSGGGIKIMKLVSYSKSNKENNITEHRIKSDGVSNTLTTGDGCSNQSTFNYVLEDKNFLIRKLTPIECERLQGYPDDHTKFGMGEDGKVFEISETQRYKLCGNGVSAPVATHILETLIPDEHIKVLSLFSGTGGTELSLSERFDVVAHCEIDKHAQNNLRYNYPITPIYPDVTKLIDEQDLPHFDLLTFGYPCQDVSIAGRNLGDWGKRSSLVFEVIELLKKHKPKYFMAENVKNHLSEMHKEFFLNVLRGFSEAGYEFDFEVVNSKNFGLPQSRERVFIFGRLIK